MVIPLSPRPDGTNTCAPVDALMIGTDTIAVAARYRTMLFDRDTGTALATPADSVPAPKLLGAVLIHADWNRVIAHDVRTGALRWAQSIATDPTFAGAGPQLEFTTTLLNPPVLIVTSPTTATAFETSGTRRWSVRFPDWIDTKVTVTDDAIIVTTNHRIIAIDSANGITRWSHSFTGPRLAYVVAVRTHRIAAVRLDRWRSDD